MANSRKVGMSQWGVQLVIGKLIAAEDFRRQFEENGLDCLRVLRERGIELSEAECAALVEMDPRVWSRAFEQLDWRLRGRRTGHAEQQRPFRLTRHEAKILHFVFDGLGNKEIAGRLEISEAAVKSTLQRLFRKVRVRTRAQLVRSVIEETMAGHRVTHRARASALRHREHKTPR
jgi:DNA-binding CsgD family transcriptional regulator